ncbi:MAG: hypothetical protein WAV20_14655, partial [Blastocatellia bacterium]
MLRKAAGLVLAFVLFSLTLAPDSLACDRNRRASYYRPAARSFYGPYAYSGVAGTRYYSQPYYASSSRYYSQPYYRGVAGTRYYSQPYYADSTRYYSQPYYRGVAGTRYYGQRYYRGRNSTRNLVLTIVGPAAVGAGIGALVGGGKGAGIGALVGGGGGALFH